LPATCDTEYFGGIDINMMHLILHQVSFFYLALFVLRQLPEYLSKVQPQLLVDLPRSAATSALAVTAS
jgi:hypothetical protein